MKTKVARSDFKPLKILSGADHRAFLLATMEGIAERRIPVPSANAIVGLSEQFHVSLKAEREWFKEEYMSGNINIIEGEIVKYIGDEDEY